METITFKFPLACMKKTPAVTDFFNKNNYPKYSEAVLPGANYGIPCGLMNGIIVFDYDLYKAPNCTVTVEDLKSRHGDTFMVATPRGGVHVYHSYEPRFDPWPGKVGLLNGLLDLRTNGNYVVGPGSQTHDGTYEIVNGTWACVTTLPDAIYQKTDQLLKEEPRNDFPEDNKTFYDVPQQVTPILDLISQKYIDNRDTWMRIGAGLFNAGYPIETFDALSKRSSKYGGVEALWQSFQRKPLAKVGFGTVCHYAKISNPSSWDKLKDTLITSSQKSEVAKFLESGSFTHGVVARIFGERFSSKYQYSCGSWYRLSKGGIYQRLTKDADTIIAKEMKTYIQGFLLSCIKHEPETQKRQAFWKANALLESHSFKVSCINELKQELIDEDLEEQLDTKPHLVGFTNGVYDLKLLVFRVGNVDDKVSMTTGYEFEPKANEENMAFIEQLFASYFENHDKFRWFMKHLASFLEGGNREEKTYFWEGSGRNGKGTTDGMMSDALGCYYVVLDNAFFTLSKKNSNQPEPEIVKLRNKRMSMTHEPEGEHKYLTSKFKKLCGGDKLQARELFDNEVWEFVPTSKPVIQTNHLPTFSDVDDGLLNRIVVVRFPFKFLSPSNFDPLDPTNRLADITLKDKLKTLKMDFFHVLLKYYRLYKEEGLNDLPSEMQGDISTYRKDIDSVQTFCTEALIHTGKDEDRMSTSELMFHHNGWAPVRLDPGRFGMRLGMCGFTIVRKMLGTTKTKCICGYKWNEEFKQSIEMNS